MAKRYIADSFEVSGGVGANVLLDDGTTVALPISFDTTSSTRLANTSGTNTGNNAINTLYSGLISADVNATNQGNTFNGISQLVQTDGTGKLPAIDGSQLTGLQALITVGTTAPTSPTVGQLWVDTN